MPSSVIFEQPDRERMVRFGRECTERYARQDQEVRRCTDPTERMRRRRRWAMRG